MPFDSFISNRFDFGLGNPNFLAALVCAIDATVVSIFLRKLALGAKPGILVIGLIVHLALALVLALTYSRGGLVSILTVLTFFIIAHRQKWAWACLMALVPAIVFLCIPSGPMRVTSVAHLASDPSISNRLSVYAADLAIISDYPWGLGDNFLWILNGVYLDHALAPVYQSGINTLLQLYMSEGFLAAILFIFTFLYSSAAVLARRRSEWVHSAYMAIFISGMFTNILASNILLAVLVVTFVLIMYIDIPEIIFHNMRLPENASLAFASIVLAALPMLFPVHRDSYENLTIQKSGLEFPGALSVSSSSIETTVHVYYFTNNPYKSISFIRDASKQLIPLGASFSVVDLKNFHLDALSGEWSKPTTFVVDGDSFIDFCVVSPVILEKCSGPVNIHVINPQGIPQHRVKNSEKAHWTLYQGSVHFLRKDLAVLSNGGDNVSLQSHANSVVESLVGKLSKPETR